MKSSNSNAIAPALRAYEAGRFGEAEQLLRQLPPREREQAAGQYLLGMVAVRTGRAGEAVPLLRRAAEAEPGNPVFRANLAIALKATGDLQSAARELTQAVGIKPDYATGLLNLGIIQLELDQPAAAQDSFERAAGIAPDTAAAHFGLGNARRALGQVESAAESYRAALRLQPDHVEALSNLGNLLAEIGDWDGAMAAFDRACELRPADTRLALNRAAKLEQAGRGQEAVTALDRLLSRQPESEEILLARLRAAWRMADTAGANETLGRLRALPGASARTWAEVGYVLESQHRLEEARGAVQRSFALAAGNAAAVLVQARIDRRSGDLAAARRGFEAVLEREESAEAANDLGQVLDEMGETDAAMASFRRGKRAFGTRADVRRCRPDSYVALVRAVRAYVEQADVAAWKGFAQGDGRAAPIFFVGFPRSGTTLMERILAGHPDIVTAEEQPFLSSLRGNAVRLSAARSPYPACLDDLSPAAILELRWAYWASVERYAGAIGQGRRFLDKLPLNIVHLVLARRIFPDARVLVALRDPRDVVLSCFMQAFQPNDAMANFLSLEGAAGLYGEVMNLWLMSRSRLELGYREYRYEDLVASPQATVRGIVEFLDLEWRDSLLEHGARAGDRLVRTPSYDAVTRPLNDRAIGRWRRYNEYLKPIAPVLVPFVTAFGYPEA